MESITYASDVQAACDKRVGWALAPAFVGQSFGFASGLPPGPELAFPLIERREFLANRVGRKADGGAEARL